MLSHAQGGLLAELRPSDTAANNLFTASMRTEITLITAVLTPGGTTPSQVKVYHDVNGSAFDNSNLRIHSTRIALTQDSVLFQANHPGSGITLHEGDSLGVEASVADNVTFAIYGVTENIAVRAD